MTQLELELTPAKASTIPSPLGSASDTGSASASGLASRDRGTPPRLLWCSDTARLGGACPYTGDRAKHRPAGGCCKDLAAR